MSASVTYGGLPAPSACTCDTGGHDVSCPTCNAPLPSRAEVLLVAQYATGERRADEDHCVGDSGDSPECVDDCPACNAFRDEILTELRDDLDRTDERDEEVVDALIGLGLFGHRVSPARPSAAAAVVDALHSVGMLAWADEDGAK